MSAATRLLYMLPASWRELLNGQPMIRQQRKEIGIGRRRDDSMLDISASNRQIYEPLLVDNYLEKDLLGNFTPLCRRDNVSLEGTSDQKIWKSLRHREVDYPKFTDLYWKMILGCVRTGEEWMDSRDCPVCNTVQLAQHLFWDCPVAQEIWRTIFAYWEGITGTQIATPKSWGALLLMGVARNTEIWRVGIHKRRWRILFGVGLWSLWTHRCAWSFKEIDNFTLPGALAKLRTLTLNRVQMDRRQALDTKTEDAFRTFRETWGYDPAEAKDPPWFTQDNGRIRWEI